MSSVNLSRRYLLGAAAGCALSTALPSWAQAAGTPGATLFVDSSAADLTGVKRVAISAFVVEFQTADKATKDGFHIASLHISDDTAAYSRWQDADSTLLQKIADDAYAALKARFTALGIEVVDTAVLTADPTYKTLQSKAGFDSGANWDNADGQSVVFGPMGLPPYMPYALELGNYECNPNPKLSKAGDNVARNPSHRMQVGNWQIPGWEIDIAKALGATLVKAWYVVNFSELSAGSKISDMTFFDDLGSGMSGVTTAYSAEARSFVRLRQEQSRISFRLPTSAKKMGYKVKNYPGTLMAAPKDGDVVVALGKPVGVGADMYSFVEGSSGAKGVGGALMGMLNSKQTFYIDATLNDPTAYSARMRGALVGAQQTLLDAAFAR
ncbi:hypothetical protein ABAC460_15235 [Asticcacaulis sp. AC460]|uniref:hypothetical protein n=1 Tax=Asticcacaulis sp. AC460 TaxID=1282360 RepID=UPI0003C3C561|nr:hypothetical protein [Asticcacaulis sp. AC460]ESQ88642.1 hypothetical protein ABAC460_15235 [Asticcacaulis sp. AC460]